jgi:hypothetical protein
VDPEFVRIDAPLHDCFAEAVRARHDDDVEKAAFRVEREDHAR